MAELPFAGHPTLGTCHAWLEADPPEAAADSVVQQCTAGLVTVRRHDGRLAFAGPPLRRSGPVDDATVAHVAELLRIERSSIVDTQWADNGPGWVAVLLGSVEEVLAVRPAPVDLDVGVVGAYPPGGDAAVEVRAFFPEDGATVEDPVTGSLNAAIAPWLIDSGRTARLRGRPGHGAGTDRAGAHHHRPARRDLGRRGHHVRDRRGRSVARRLPVRSVAERSADRR